MRRRDDSRGEGSHLGNGDLNAGHRGQHKLLGSRSLLHLGDRSKRLCRPVELHLRNRQAIADLGSKRVEQESIQDELVAGDKSRD